MKSTSEASSQTTGATSRRSSKSSVAVRVARSMSMTVVVVLDGVVVVPAVSIACILNIDILNEAPAVIFLFTFTKHYVIF